MATGVRLVCVYVFVRVRRESSRVGENLMRQLCIRSWAARGDGRDLAPPVKSFPPPGRCLDTVISRDSWRERALEEKACLVRLSDIKYDFRNPENF